VVIQCGRTVYGDQMYRAQWTASCQGRQSQARKAQSWLALSGGGCCVVTGDLARGRALAAEADGAIATGGWCLGSGAASAKCFAMADAILTRCWVVSSVEWWGRSGCHSRCSAAGEAGLPSRGETECVIRAFGKCGNSDPASANGRSRDGSSLHMSDRLFLPTCMNLLH
jgi:hypothetical protein